MDNNVTAKEAYSRLKTVVDILSSMSILTMIIIPLWCVYDPAFHSHLTPGSKLPIQLKLLLLDGIPTLFGVIWLSYRHAETQARRWAFVRTLRFRLLAMTCALVYG